jgi:hypothetical protein
MDDLRVVRIKNTSSLEYLQISRALEKEAIANSNLSVEFPWREIGFDGEGNLSDFTVS